MIRDVEYAVSEVCQWITDRKENAKATTLVVGISGGIDSAVVAALCKRAGSTIGVALPCDSSPTSMDRANELADALDIELLTVNLKDSFTSIKSQVRSSLWNLQPSVTDDGALRSCLRAPALDYVAKLTKGIIVGTGNRDEDEMTRYFQKRGDGAVDISPIAKFHKSEVYQLARHLKIPESIIKAKPSADLWGPDAGQEDEKELGISYDEIEWGIREFFKAGSAFVGEETNLLLPVGTYTVRQMDVLKKLQEMEFTSRHKAHMPPVFEARLLGLTD